MWKYKRGWISREAVAEAKPEPLNEGLFRSKDEKKYNIVGTLLQSVGLKTIRFC